MRLNLIILTLILFINLSYPAGLGKVNKNKSRKSKPTEKSTDFMDFMMENMEKESEGSVDPFEQLENDINNLSEKKVKQEQSSFISVTDKKKSKKGGQLGQKYKSKIMKAKKPLIITTRPTTPKKTVALDESEAQPEVTAMKSKRTPVYTTAKESDSEEVSTEGITSKLIKVKTTEHVLTTEQIMSSSIMSTRSVRDTTIGIEKNIKEEADIAEEPNKQSDKMTKRSKPESSTTRPFKRTTGEGTESDEEEEIKIVKSLEQLITTPLDTITTTGHEVVNTLLNKTDKKIPETTPTTDGLTAATDRPSSISIALTSTEADDELTEQIKPPSNGGQKRNKLKMKKFSTE